MNEWMNEWMSEWTNERTNERMNQNNITFTCQHGKVFYSFLHIHVSVAYLIYKQENNSLCKTLSQDTINSLNDRPVPSS